MKIVIFGALILLLVTEIRADLSNQPSKIQSLVRKLFNLKPDRNIAHSLGKPVKLNTNEEQVDIESSEILGIIYQFSNVTVSKLYINDQRPKIQYTSLTCDFHQQLKITQAIDPPDLEIEGLYEYDLQKSPGPQKPAEKFIIKQYGGKFIYKIMSNGTTDTDLVYYDQQAKYGESNKHLMTIVRAIGGIAADVNNRTANQLKHSTNLPQKIKDFEHIFPFLSGSLSPLNKTALRSQDENMYIINNTGIERWEKTYWVPSYVVIRGLNNFKRAKIMAYDDAKRVRFNLTLSTNKLNGYFEWRYDRNENSLIFNATQNFTIDNLTVTANTIFDKDWIVDKVEVDLGSIILQKPNVTESNVDINEITYNIFHENLQTTIKTHLKQLIHEEYSQPRKSDGLGTSANELKTASTRNLVNNTNKTTKEGQLVIDLLNRTTILSPSTLNDTICKDDRRWWQKIYRWNKCKQNKKPTTPQVPETNKCVDKRWWFQKPFVSNQCVKNVSSKSIPATQQIPESVPLGSTPATQQISESVPLGSTPATQQIPVTKIHSDLQQDEMKKCVDTRWWFQKPFIRNKCKPEKK